MAEPTPSQPPSVLPVPLLPVPALSRRVIGFPTLLPPLIGRDRELAALRALLCQPVPRLITLIGPGGVGKTRLAVAAALATETEFEDGIVFVPLATISGPRLVFPAIAKALDIRETPDHPLRDALLASLRQQKVLLVLDNFEHVVDAAMDVFTLLETCPRARVLVTSRAPLRLHEEQRFVTPPLALPGDDLTAPDDLAEYGAIALFIARAQGVSNLFALDDDNAAAVIEICRRLDGLPLAIELAAAWVRVLAPGAILDRLEPRLPLLRGGPSDQPARLRTMRDAIAWSYDLLTEEEQRLFRRLAVFVVGFDLTTAEWVSGLGFRVSGDGDRVPGSVPDTQHPTPDTLDVLAALVDKSLVRQTPTRGSTTRFSMLETIREFGRDQLAKSGEADAVETAYADAVLQLAEQADPELMGSRQADWFERLEVELANLRAVLDWFLAHGEGERGLRLANALNWFWSSRGYFREARRWLESFLAIPTTAETRGRGLLEVANILHWQGEHAQAAAYADESLEIFRDRGDRYLALCALRRLGSIAIDESDFERAAARLTESRGLLETSGSAWDRAFASYLDGRLDVAAGRNADAVAHFQDAIDAFRAIGDRGYVASALGQQAAAAIHLGDHPAARSGYAESLEIAHTLKDLTSVAWAVAGAAHLAHAAGEAVTATRLLAAAATIRDAIGERRLPRGALSETLLSILGCERFAVEWALGARWTTDEAIAVARAILVDEARGRMPRGDGDAPRLTRRERDVLRLLAEGQSDKEIAAVLGLSRRTISSHVGSILAKLGVESRTAAATFALRHDLLGGGVRGSAGS